MLCLSTFLVDVFTVFFITFSLLTLSFTILQIHSAEQALRNFKKMMKIYFEVFNYNLEADLCVTTTKNCILQNEKAFIYFILKNKVTVKPIHLELSWFY